ncbi:hypothetical protein [Rhodopseudomonas palustris]|uniref:hypothetical protein n=1 Tax=Rhodopseudomonas palustris TaxID=1076 RepID=UPI001600F5B0|nr:hypothetical protein [Rhodopseudomonas palustris]
MTTFPDNRDNPRQYHPTDVSPEQLFAAWSRRDREALIDVLIESLDAADADPDLEPAGDDEPTLGSIAEHTNWAGGSTDDREGDDGCDDREGDELQHGGDEHDGCEPDVDAEDALGWTIDGALGYSGDHEEGSTTADALAAAWARYNGKAPSPRLQGPGRAVSVDRLSWRRRLTGLSALQLAAVSPRLDRREVGL